MSFADMYDEAVKKDKEAPKKAAPVFEAEKEQPKRANVLRMHPSDDPAIRKERKERRKEAKQTDRAQQEVVRSNENNKREKRKLKQKQWDEQRAVASQYEKEGERRERIVEDAIEAVGRLQALVASGVAVNFRHVFDYEALEANAQPLKGKKSTAADAICKDLELVAEKLQQGALSPYLVATRLSNVATAFLTAFEPLLAEALPEASSRRIINWVKGQRSFVGRDKTEMIEESKAFAAKEHIPGAGNDEGDDDDEEDDAEGEDAEEAGGEEATKSGATLTAKPVKRPSSGKAAAAAKDDEDSDDEALVEEAIREADAMRAQAKAEAEALAAAQAAAENVKSEAAKTAKSSGKKRKEEGTSTTEKPKKKKKEDK
ncbi:hypothetical protein DIPPA_35949 [Diplonema papillatum]|nr:hypothetical protein DIPPA_35949 [Diplonema papillatum]